MGERGRTEKVGLFSPGVDILRGCGGWGVRMEGFVVMGGLVSALLIKILGFLGF